jgi:hypothetical protein
MIWILLFIIFWAGFFISDMNGNIPHDKKGKNKYWFGQSLMALSINSVFIINIWFPHLKL